MENDILEGAKFGDKFLTRDGCICRYITSDSDEILFNETTNDICQYYPDGNIFGSDNEDCNYPHDIEHKWDIISRYQEPIDEDKLNEEAKDFAYKEVSSHYEAVFHKPLPTNRENFGFISCEKAYKAGYRKAMEEYL